MRALSLALMILGAACAPGEETTPAHDRVPGTSESPTGRPDRSSRDSRRYLALGDSYTIGESVEAAERWPQVLSCLLEARGIPTSVDVIARTGWTTEDLAAAIDRTDPDAPYDLVTSMIGVNDQFRGLDLEGFRTRFAALLDRGVGLARGAHRVIAVTIPDWGVTPFGAAYDAERIAAAIDDFNAVIVDEAGTREVTVVDVTTITRERRHLVASDGLHPSAEMHRMWAEMVLPGAEAVLRG